MLMVCIPELLSPKTGFGMKVTVLPWATAVLGDDVY